MIALVLSMACSGGADSAEPGAAKNDVVAALGENVWVPRYRDFQAGAEALAGSVDGFCAAPDGAGLTAAREAWWAAAAPWKQSEALAFGPYTWWEYRFGPVIDGWPADIDALQGLLESEAAIDDSLLGSMGSTTLGLPPLEWLLYGAELEGFTGDGGRRCALSALLAGQLAADAAGMAAAWDPAGDDVLGTLADPGEDDPYFMSPEEVLEEYFNRMVFAVENVRIVKLGKPVGYEDGGGARPELVEAPYSGRSLEHSRDAIRGVLQQWDGAYGGADGLGVVDLLPGGDRERLGGVVQAAAERGLEALDAVPGPLAQAVEQDPAAVEAAIDALVDLQVALQVEAAQCLQVTIQFNDTDGD